MSRKAVAGFWMSSTTTLSYEVYDPATEGRYQVDVEFATAEEAKARCAETIRSITAAVAQENLVTPRKAAYLLALADLIADWVVATMNRQAERKVLAPL